MNINHPALTEAERHNALLAAAIQASPDGVVITDPLQPDNPVIFVNQAFSAMTLYAPEEAIGRNCRFLQGIHTDRETAALIGAKIRAREAVHVTILNYRKDGTQFWNDLRINPVFDQNGQLMNFIALQADVTDMRATQEALRLAKEQAERATSVKSDFMAMISHEIRTPINGVLGTLTLLKDTPQTAEQRHLTETALSSGQTLLTVVNDILDFSKIEAGKLAIEAMGFDLPELIREVAALARPAAEQKSLTLEAQLDAALPRHVTGDPTRIRQVLLNLASNAIKFTERGGITIKASNLITQGGDAGAQCILRFEVIDTGIGINPEGQTRLFTEFDQLDPSIARRYGGTGLGLAICKRLVALMRGEIGVESRPGEGSKFWFVLPLLVAATEAQSSAPSADAGGQKCRGKILIVEDHPTNQMVLAAYLRKAGHDVAIADDGAAGLAMVQADAYDLVFMDISMPVMDGLTATRHIRALGGVYASLPILAMTALAMTGDREKCFAAGMNDFVSKPIDPDALRRATQHWLAARKNSEGRITGNDAALPPPAMSPSTTAPVMDHAVVEQMRQELGAAIVRNLLAVFGRDLQQRQNILASAIANDDWAAVARESHALKSSSASCGLMEFSSLMEAIELAAQDNDPARIKSFAGRIDPCAKAAQSVLAEYGRQ